jgi:hypothetical protein
MTKKISLILTIIVWQLSSITSIAQAKQVLGVHILHPAEITEAAQLIKNEVNADSWSYVTIPLSLADLNKQSEWQDAFNQAKTLKINPIIRLASRFDSEKNSWTIPTRGEILQIFDFLKSLSWPHEKKYLIVFNEPNHQTEWGNTLDPESYAQILSFTADWAHTENLNYQILPAAMDLAAPNGKETTEAFTFLEAMLKANPEIFTKLDYWNSHSYPNPGFSAAANKTGQNSLRGFEHELKWLKEKTNREFQVFITETGWEENAKTRSNLSNYYDYANDKIWSNENIIAITPFVLKGDPGPFANFTLIDKDGNFTRQYSAYAKQIATTAQKNKQDLEQIQIPNF